MTAELTVYILHISFAPILEEVLTLTLECPANLRQKEDSDKPEFNHFSWGEETP